MPKHLPPSRLENLCMNAFCSMCAKACFNLETERKKRAKGQDELDYVPPKGCEWTEHESQFCDILSTLPGTLLESVVSNVIRIIAKEMRKNRSHPGMVSALDLLPQRAMRRLDIGALFSGVRLYGFINSKCFAVLTKAFTDLPNLTHLNLESKCNDAILKALSQSCHHLQELNIPQSDVTNNGLMFLCGMSYELNSVKSGQGCPEMTRLNVRDCMNVSLAGLACIVRNLHKLLQVSHDQLTEAIELVASVDPDYLYGRRVIKLTHLEQFRDYWEFSKNEHLIQLLKRLCPNVESLRFYTSDEGCKKLSEFVGIRHLQLETEIIDKGFECLVQKYTNLVSLHLIFRFMSYKHLTSISECCKNLETLRLFGFEIASSNLLAPKKDTFEKLKALDIKILRQTDGLPEEEEDDESNIDSISPELLHFLLDGAKSLEDISIESFARFVDKQFILDLLEKNPMPWVSKLKIWLGSSCSGLNYDTAIHLLLNLPSIQVLGLSRWNLTRRDFLKISKEIKCNNYDIIIV